MTASFAGALVLFAGWIAAFTVMARRAHARRRSADEPAEDTAAPASRPDVGTP
jgi:hypothetical protein